MSQSSDGHATVVWLSNSFISTFQLKWKNFEKSRWTVTRQSLKVTRPSTDCQTTFYRRFNRNGKILKKVAERPRDSRQRSSDRRPTVKQLCFDVSTKMAKFEKKSLNGSSQSSDGHATVVWLSNNFISTFKLNWRNFDKSYSTVPRQSSKVTRPSTDCRTTFFRRFNQNGKILRKSRWTVTRQLSDGDATVAWLSNNFILTFQQKWENFEKVAERSRDIRRRSRNRRPTVEQPFSTFQPK